MARIRMSISFDLPEGATREDALAYAVDAVMTMKGCLRPAGGLSEDDPGDPMFYLDSDSVEGSFATTRGNRRRIVRCRGED
jgi:hypothetical protein